jgi:type I restriction enzyme S subunit
MTPRDPFEPTESRSGSDAFRQLPDDWKWRALGSFGEIVGGGTPSRSVQGYWSGRIPWASVKDFSGDSTVLDDTQEHVTEEAIRASAATLVPPDTPVVCTRMAVGRCALTSQATAINQDLKAFLLGENVDPEFFIRVLHLFGHELDRVSVGSTVRGISLSDLDALKVPCPEQRAEQTRIARILDLFDSAIRQADESVRKLKQLRAGLLHDLLTRGIDENGELRDPVRSPRAFSETPLGLLPRSWRADALSAFLQNAEYGISSSLSDKGTTPVLRMNNFSDGEAEVDDLKYTSLTIPESLMLRPGDVLFNRTNSLEHVGRTGIWRGQIDRATFASYLVRLNPKQSRLRGELLNLGLGLPLVQKRMRQFATTAVQQVNINPTSLGQMLFAAPASLSEQDTIVYRLRQFDEVLREEEAARLKLRNLKTGLSNDLLTGRVRVPECAFGGSR